MQESGVSFVAFGRLEDRTLLYHFCFEEKYEKKFAQEAQSLLVKFQPLKLAPGDHQKIKSPNGSWYCAFDEKRMAYFALCSVYYSEAQAYRMLSEIQTSVQEEVPSYWQKNPAEMTAYAKTFVPEIAEKFKDLDMKDNLAKAQAQLDQVRAVAGQSVQDIANNVSTLGDIEEKSVKINQLGLRLSQDANELALQTKRRMRMRLMIGGLILVIIALFFIVFS